jgi:hypothetical protein
LNKGMYQKTEKQEFGGTFYFLSKIKYLKINIYYFEEKYDKIF